ncbi:MAG: glucosaminidase domain-containing protein [Bacteroidota bacterium]|nr:glucosaminidase domain-containing protein [Bacteroidota bacterium]
MYKILKICFLFVFLFTTDQDLFSSFYTVDEPNRTCEIYKLGGDVLIKEQVNPISSVSGKTIFPNNFFIAYQYHKNVQIVHDSLFDFSFLSFSSVKRENIEVAFVHNRINSVVKKESSVLRKFSIMGEGEFVAAQLCDFLLSNNKSVDSIEAINLADLYIEESKVEGVNHDIAFIQMCHETGFLRYDGVVSKNQNNFCGLGTVNQETPGEVFSSEEEGVRAHIQHLKAYASQHDLKQELVDNRFRFVKRGVAPQLEDLTGRWAVDKLYDKKIIKLINSIEKFTVKNSGKS